MALISRAMAERYWSGREVLGEKIRLAAAGPDAPPITVVGVVADVRNDNASAPPLPMLYFPFAQRPFRTPTYVLHMADGQEFQAAAIRNWVHSIEPRSRYFNFNPCARFFLTISPVLTSLWDCWARLPPSHSACDRRHLRRSLAHHIRATPGDCDSHRVGAQPGQVMRLFVWKGLRLALYGVSRVLSLQLPHANS